MATVLDSSTNGHHHLHQTVAAALPSVHTSLHGTLHQQHPAQDLILGAYFGGAGDSAKELSSADHHLDLNVHAIKNMLMANRVPESCV